MNVNFDRQQESDGTYSITITFTKVPNEKQALAAENLVKRALMVQGAVGSTMPFPEVRRRIPKSKPGK